MANVQEFLDKAMAIDGAIGAALVDHTSGTCLGTQGGGPLDMELAGANAVKIVKAKQDIIRQLDLEESSEETLLTMERQYHLIRLSAEDEAVFSYLILDRDQASLPLARTHLKSLDQDLSIESAQPPEDAF